MPESVLPSEDLDAVSLPGVPLAVLGYPVKHSISPAIHNAALAEMAKTDPAFGQWLYHCVEVPAERLPEVLPKLRHAGFHGLNLTIPHKVQAMGLVENLSSEAECIGAVNTLIASPETSGWNGDNTDGHGFEQAVRRDLGVELGSSRVILLGAGGAARAAAARCLLADCPEVHIGNRSPERLDELLALLPVSPSGRRATGFVFSSPPEDLPKGEDVLIVNATSLGLRYEDPAPFDLAGFSAEAKLYDMIYNPPETDLLREARGRGMEAANGLSMLVLQAARSLEVWTQAEVPVDTMFAAAEEALSQ